MKNTLELTLARFNICTIFAQNVQKVTFTIHRETCPSVTLNRLRIPRAEGAKYLELHLDRRLNWKKHTFPKREQLGLN